MFSYRGLATSLFGGLVDKYPEFFSVVKKSLPRANIRIPFRTYMGMVFLTSTIVFIASLIGVWIVLNIIETLFVLRIVYLILVPFSSFLVSFVALFFYPYQKMMSRKTDIDANLPFAIMHMGAIAESGAPPHGIFRLMANFEEYGELCYEMKRIVRNMDIFGLDPLSAIREVANKTPSDGLKSVLFSFVTATESGGDVKTLLKNAGQQALFEWRIKRQRFLQQLSAYAEFYTGLLIAAPLFIIALLSVMNMISPTMGGFNILDLMRMSIYILIPALNLGFLMFLHGVEVEI